MATPDRERYRRARELFHAAVELDPERRAAYLEDACGADPGLRAEVEKLLEAAETPTTQLFALPAEAPSGDAGEVGGQRRYELLDKLGRGGMGTVFRARRADGEFQQSVAVKVIRRDRVGAGSLVDRFRTERQILANLNHPGIARLLDGGSTAGGRPFLVMELVDGEPIDRYCDRRRLGVAARIRLCRRVCLAVHYAHRNLVVHGDLKPGNVLVTGDGTPKLLDFGIAQLLAGDGAAVTTATPAMTPSYASPEQVAGEPLTTASDVYSLGVLLSRLLTGRLPYGPTDGGRVSLLLAIRDRPPEAPSAAASRPSERHEKAVECGLPSRQLVRRLRGDLDAVVLRALAKRPEDRYASAEQLAADLGRHLDGFPVLARNAGPLHRAAKAARRNPLLTLAAGALLMTGLAFLGTAKMQAERTARERDRAERVVETLVEMFEISDPAQVGVDELTAGEVVERGLEAVDRGLGGDPRAAAAVYHASGRVLRGLGRYDQAVEVLEKALAERRALLGERHPEIAATLGELGVARLFAGDLEGAEPALREALEIRRRRLGEEHADTAASYNALGLLLSTRQDAEAAEAHLRTSLEIRQRLFGPEHLDVAESLGNLGEVYHDLGDLERAEEHYRRGLAIRRALLEPDHPSVAESVNNLGLALKDQGRYDAAAPLLREALELRTARLGPEHPDIAVALDNLAILERLRGDLAKAIDMHRKAVATFRQAHPDGHVDVAISLNNLAKALLEHGDDEEAVSLLDEAVRIARGQYGEQHSLAAILQTNLGQALVAAGRYTEAGRQLVEAEAILRAVYGDRHLRLAVNLFRQAELRSALGEPDRAEALLSGTLAMREALLEAPHPDLAETRLALARLLLARGAGEEAAALASQALAERRALFPADDLRVVEAEAFLAETARH